MTRDRRDVLDFGSINIKKKIDNIIITTIMTIIVIVITIMIIIVIIITIQQSNELHCCRVTITTLVLGIKKLSLICFFQLVFLLSAT